MGAQTELGKASSDGISPLVIATAMYVPFMFAVNFCSVKGMVLSLPTIARDAVLASTWGLMLISVAAVLYINSDVLAARYFSISSAVYAMVYAYGLFHRDMLRTYIQWPWRGLHMAVGAAGLIMAFYYLSCFVLSEALIARGNQGLWVLARILWAVFGLKLAHALVILHQLWIRSPKRRAHYENARP
ncbi:MAG: hypothetical protein ACRBBK_07660 [Paracoccaceae bacterium]